MVLGIRSRTVLLTMAMYESTRFRMVSTCRSSWGSMECMKLSEPFSSVSLAYHWEQMASGWLDPQSLVPGSPRSQPLPSNGIWNTEAQREAIGLDTRTLAPPHALGLWALPIPKPLRTPDPRLTLSL